MASPKYRERPLKGLDLIEIQRANLRALLRHLYREQGSWVRVAHTIGYRRSVVVGFFDGVEPGNMALARAIARAVGLDIADALAGKASPRKLPQLVLVTPKRGKRGAS